MAKCVDGGDGRLWGWLKFFRVLSCWYRDRPPFPLPLGAVVENTRTGRAGLPRMLSPAAQVRFLLSEMPGIAGLEHVLVESCLRRKGR